MPDQVTPPLRHLPPLGQAAGTVQSAFVLAPAVNDRHTEHLPGAARVLTGSTRASGMTRCLIALP